MCNMHPGSPRYLRHTSGSASCCFHLAPAAATKLDGRKLNGGEAIVAILQPQATQAQHLAGHAAAGKGLGSLGAAAGARLG